MKRGAPMKRTPMTRGTRLRPVSRKTRETRWPALTTLRAHVLARAKGRCEACKIIAGVDVHHVAKRSQRRDDSADNAIYLCRFCHRRTDESFAKGRLVITALGRARFACAVVYAKDKWAARAGQ